MRALGRPEVIKSAFMAALLTGLASYPRLTHGPGLKYPAWYLECLLFLGSMVLWAFAFAWYTRYSGRPLFILKMGWKPFALATGVGIVTAVLVSFGDPALRARSPQDYPTTLSDWVAMTLFSLAFTQLFLVFAPFSWALRLFQRVSPAILVTVLFGLFVLAVKNRAPPTPIPSGMLLNLLLFRIIAGLVSVYFLLRGGVLLVWWWSLLLQSRHLLHLAN
jgi:hypothetical protein